jgi:hypothetical protein
MELSHDWREFQAVFHPTRKRGSQTSALEPNWIAVIADAGNILAVAGDIEGGWEGRPVEELKAAYSKRAIQIFERQDVDRWMSGSLALPHFYDQTEYLRSQTSAQSLTTHFLLQAVQGWWGKILPSAYGIFFRIVGPSGTSGAPARELFVLIRRGKVELFHTPDCTALSADRARDPEAVVRYLSEKHIVPVQGIVVSSMDWEDWTLRSLSHSEAWRKLCFAVQSGQAQLAPFRWRLMALASTRAFLGI